MLQPDVFCKPAAKCDCGTPDTAGGSYSASPDTIAGFKGVTLRQGGEGWNEERAGKEGKGGKLEQGHRLAKADPELATAAVAAAYSVMI